MRHSPPADRFTVLAPCRDGCATVLRATDVAAGRPVVLKSVADPDALERQVALCTHLAHPGFPTLLDVDREHRLLVFEPAPDVLSVGEPLTADVTRSLARDLLGAALELAARGLEHTRIDREHVLVHWGGRAMLCGLGSVREAPAPFADATETSDAAARTALAIGRTLLACLTAATTDDDRAAPRYAIAEANAGAFRDDPALVGVVDALLAPDATRRLHPSVALGVLNAGHRRRDIRPRAATH